MSTTIKIVEHETLGLSVSARELYNLIAVESSKSKKDLGSDWFRARVEKLELTEGIDYITWRNNTEFVSDSGRVLIDFHITLNVAKRIAKLQLKKRGLGVLAYLNEYERAGGPPTALQDAETLLRDTFNPPAPETEIAPAMEPEQPGSIDARLSMIERNLTALMGLFQPTLFGAGGATEPEPQLEPTPKVETTRSKLVRLVDLYEMAQLTNKRPITHQRIWNMLYAQLSFRHGFDTYAMGNGKKDPNYLDIAEKNGQIENLYELATELLIVE